MYMYLSLVAITLPHPVVCHALNKNWKKERRKRNAKKFLSRSFQIIIIIIIMGLKSVSASEDVIGDLDP